MQEQENARATAEVHELVCRVTNPQGRSDKVAVIAVLGLAFTGSLVVSAWRQDSGVGSLLTFTMSFRLSA